MCWVRDSHPGPGGSRRRQPEGRGVELEHPRFGKNPQPRTLLQIADLTAWIEAQTSPFTLMEAFRACSATATAYRASWSTTHKTTLELRDKGLLQQMNPKGSHTGLWLHVSQLKGQQAEG